MPQDISSPWIFTDIRQWNALIRTAETVSLEKDAIIYEQGERAEYVYVVKTGRVRLTSFLPNGREQIFMFIEEGGMFGEAELFEGGVRLTDANAITDVVLYRSTLHDFRKLINTDIDFSNSVLALTSRKFSRLVGMMQSLVFTDIRGIKLGALVQNIFTVGKLGALALVIVGGWFVMKGANFTTMTTETVEWGRSFTAAVPALLAFGGYYTLAYMSEDIENPNKNLPLAMMLGMGIVIIVNVLLNMSCIGAVGFAELAGSSTPVTDAAKVIFGPIGAIIVTLGAMVSIFGSLNGTLLSTPRVPLAMSRDGMLFPFFGKLHPKYQTPYISIIIFSLAAIAFLWTGTFMTLLMMGVFVSRSLECIVTLSLIVLRKKKPDAHRPLKMWGYPVTAVLAIVITGYLVSLVDPKQMLNGALLMATSIPAYFIFRYTVKNRKKSGQ